MSAQVGDVFYSQRRGERIVIVEEIDDRYVRVVGESDPEKSRLWRRSYLETKACEPRNPLVKLTKIAENWKSS